MEDDQLELKFNSPLMTLPQLWTPDDIYSACNEEVVRRFSEDGRVERKRAGISQKDLSEYVSMWANTQPSGGITFLGVRDDGGLVGCKNTEQSHINDLEAVRVLCPDARLEFKRIPIVNVNSEPDFVLARRVYYREDKLVETQDGNAYVREGDRKRRLTEQEKREIRLNKGELDVESEKVSLSFPDDFNADLLSQYLRNYVGKRQLRQQYKLEDVLAMSKLGKKGPNGFAPNLGCALLFAKDQRFVER